MEKRKFTLVKKIKFTLILLLLFFIVIVIIGEIGYRLFFSDQKEYSEKSLIDEELGWKPKEDYQASYKMQSKGKDPNEWEVNYTTSKNGFRQWPSVDAKKPTILVIGDSFVQSVEVSTDKTFYKHMADSLKANVFAFGQAGYGTLQQKMILSKYIKEIKPDLVILQTCDNDFVDNHAPLEYDSDYRVGLRRPYYDLSGNLDYRTPQAKWKDVLDKSKFLGLLRRKIEYSFFKKSRPSSQKLMAELGDKYEPYLQAQKITGLVLKEMKEICGDIPLVAFSASPYEPQVTDFKKQLASANIPFFEEVGKQIHASYWEGNKVLTRDGYHWSEKGHIKVANLLIENLIVNGLTEKLLSQS